MTTQENLFLFSLIFMHQTFNCVFSSSLFYIFLYTQLKAKGDYKVRQVELMFFSIIIIFHMENVPETTQISSLKFTSTQKILNLPKIHKNLHEKGNILKAKINIE
jgi:hypothetical protein